jgi:hypothetical protein
MTRVLNLATGEQQFYSCSAIDAVISAFAHENKDGNTWEYQNRYSDDLLFGNLTVSCGDWTAFRDDNEGLARDRKLAGNTLRMRRPVDRGSGIKADLQ